MLALVDPFGNLRALQKIRDARMNVCLLCRKKLVKDDPDVHFDEVLGGFRHDGCVKKLVMLRDICFDLHVFGVGFEANCIHCKEFTYELWEACECRIMM